MKQGTTPFRTAKFCIWTLRWQSVIAQQLRMFTWTGTAVILFLAVAGRISLDTALHSIVISLFSIAALVYLFLQARRTSLLRIEDPALREAAHEAMLLLIHQRRLSKSDRRLLKKHFGENYCELGHCG
ncbi:MAG: hypothetical protein ACOWWM_00070 [Desulfobacterales bacterium]